MQPSDPRALIRVAREAGGEAHVEPVNLGERVRELRRSRGWTLEEAATRAGLARSTLSKIENGQMSPTFDAVKKLAQGLAISVPQLFTAPSRAQVNGRMAITKSGAGLTQATATYEHELLAASLTKKQMLPYRAIIRADPTVHRVLRADRSAPWRQRLLRRDDGAQRHQPVRRGRDDPLGDLAGLICLMAGKGRTA
jgi:transcriptional regulator with XRE-family HTH domain